MTTKPKMTSNMAKGHDENDRKRGSSSIKFDFNGILNIQPVDEANIEYLTVEMKVNGVSREVRVPVPFLNRRYPDDVPKVASAVSSSTPDGSIIRNLLTELEEEVSHHVKSSEKVTRDVNENQISDLAKSGTNSGDSQISLDNVIVIAPDDDDDDDRDGGGGGRPVDKRPVAGNADTNRLAEVAPKVAPLATVRPPVVPKVANPRPAVTPITVIPEAAYQSGKVTQNSGRVIILRGSGVKHQYMAMSKQSGDVFLTPVSRSSCPAVVKPSSANPAGSTTILRLVGDKAGIVGSDGNIYIPVGTTPGQGSILKKAFPMPKASTTSSELNLSSKIGVPLTKHGSVMSNNGASNALKTVGLKTLDQLKGPRSVLKTSAAASCAKPVVPQSSVLSSSPSRGSVDDLRISSVCSLLPCQEQKNGSSTECTPGKGLLHAILNDLQKPLLESNSTKPDDYDVSSEDHIKPDDTQTVSSPGGDRDDKSREGRFFRKGEEINPEWLKGFKEDPELRVMVEQLDLGPRFKSIHVDRLQHHLAYRRRQRRAERIRQAADHVYSAKGPQNVKKEETSNQSRAKEERNSNEKIDKPDKMIMIKTSLGSYILPMVPGLTMSGLLRSLNSGLVKLPPVKTQCLLSSAGVLLPSGNHPTSVTAPNTAPSAYSSALLTVKTEPGELVQGSAVPMQHSGLTTPSSRVSVIRLPPATETTELQRKPPSLSLNSSSKRSPDNSVALLKRPALSDSDLIKPKKTKTDVDVDYAAETKAGDSSSQAVDSSKGEQQNSKQTGELSHVNRIKLLKEMLKEQEAAIEKMRKQRLKISTLLKEIE